MSARTCSAMNVTVQPPTYSAATISRLKHEPSAHLRGMSHTKCPHNSETRRTPPPLSLLRRACYCRSTSAAAAEPGFKSIARDTNTQIDCARRFAKPSRSENMRQLAQNSAVVLCATTPLTCSCLSMTKPWVGPSWRRATEAKDFRGQGLGWGARIGIRTFVTQMAFGRRKKRRQY